MGVPGTKYRAALTLLVALLPACWHVSPSSDDAAPDSGAGGDTDDDAGSDSDTDTDTDVDADTDTEDTDTGWVELPAGSFWMGDEDEEVSNEQP